MISILHPSRGRPLKSFDTLSKWCRMAKGDDFEIIISLDSTDDQSYRYLYPNYKNVQIIINENRSCVDAINNAAKIATGNLFFVVSDDTLCFDEWDHALLKEVEDKEDFVLKTVDGIQDYIVTQTIMDRKYFNRDGVIYFPDFKHQFADTYLTCLADIRGRLIRSKLKFLHDHYSVNGTQPDDLHKRNDYTWKEGEPTFIRLMKQFTREELNRIQDQSMKNWLRMKKVI